MANQYTKNQHTITKAYLGGFSNNGWAFYFDKVDQKIKKGHIKSMTVVEHFYSRRNADGTYDDAFEKELSKVESGINLLISELENNPNCLPDYKKELHLIDFLSLLAVRTTWLKTKSQKVHVILTNDKNRFIEEGKRNIANSLKVSEPNIPTEEIEKMSKMVYDDILNNSQKEDYHLDLIEHFRDKWKEVISSRNWHITKLPEGSNLVVSDNPIYMKRNPLSTDFNEFPLPIPLNKNICLILGKPGGGIYPAKIQSIADVEEVNSAQLDNAQRYVISHSKELLAAIVKNYIQL